MPHPVAPHRFWKYGGMSVDSEQRTSVVMSEWSPADERRVQEPLGAVAALCQHSSDPGELKVAQTLGEPAADRSRRGAAQPSNINPGAVDAGE